MTMKLADRIQESEYSFPYHYIPFHGSTGPEFVRRWPWGLKYLGGIELIADKLEQMDFKSLVEIGCGDGRLLAEVARRFPGRRLLGVDYSDRAIGFARAFNPELRFVVADVTRPGIDEPPVR